MTVNRLPRTPSEVQHRVALGRRAVEEAFTASLARKPKRQRPRRVFYSELKQECDIIEASDLLPDINRIRVHPPLTDYVFMRERFTDIRTAEEAVRRIIEETDVIEIDGRRWLLTRCPEPLLWFLALFGTEEEDLEDNGDMEPDQD